MKKLTQEQLDDLEMNGTSAIIDPEHFDEMMDKAMSHDK